MKFTALTHEQRTFFETHGYLIVRNALDGRMIEQLIRVGDRLMAGEIQENRQKSSAYYDGFRNCIALDDAFISLLTHSKTVPLVAQLLSPNLRLLTSHLIYKYPKPQESGVADQGYGGWHRDNYWVPHDLGHAEVPRMSIKVAYYLSDHRQAHTGMTLMAPGSHLLKTQLAMAPGRRDPKEFVEPKLAAGDALLFENRAWHSANAPLTVNQTRKCVMFGYCYGWLQPSDYMTQPDALLEKVDDIGKQLLGGLSFESETFDLFYANEPLRKWAEFHGVLPDGYPKPAVASK